MNLDDIDFSSESSYQERADIDMLHEVEADVHTILDYSKHLEKATTTSDILNFFVDHRQFEDNTNYIMPTLTLSDEDTITASYVDFLMVVSQNADLSLMFIDRDIGDNTFEPLTNARGQISIQFREQPIIWKNKFIKHVQYDMNSYLFGTLSNPLDQIFLIFSKDDGSFEHGVKLPLNESKAFFLCVVLPFLSKLKNVNGATG